MSKKHHTGLILVKNFRLMKIMFVLLCCALFFSSCVSNNESIYTDDYNVYDDLPGMSNHIQDILSIRNSDGDVIYYGMNRADVEHILGQGEESFLNNAFSYMDGDITILYRDDAVVMIILHWYTDWTLANGIYFGMQIYERQVFYGNKTVEESRQFSRYAMNRQAHEAQATVDFRFILEDDNYLRLLETFEEYGEVRRATMTEEGALSNRFMVSLMVPDDTIYLISIGDQQALFTFR